MRADPLTPSAVRALRATAGIALALGIVSGAQAAEQTHYYDGGRAVPVWIDRDSGTISRSPPATAANAPVTRDTPSADARAAKLPPASASAQTVTPSPLMSLKAQRTAPGARGLTDALPGGVLVQLKTPLAAAEARAYLVNRGLDPVREIGSGSGTWLVASEAGEAALTLANQLHDSGEFALAQPNWRGRRVSK